MKTDPVSLWLLIGSVTLAALAGGTGCGGEGKPGSQPVSLEGADAGPAVPKTVFGTGTGLTAADPDQFVRNFVAIACAAYTKVCGCDASAPQACTPDKNLAAVNLYDCMFTRAYCLSPSGASACGGIGAEARKYYLEGNKLCSELNLASLDCERWMKDSFGASDGKNARTLWATSDPYPEDVDALIETCARPPRQ